MEREQDEENANCSPIVGHRSPVRISQLVVRKRRDYATILTKINRPSREAASRRSVALRWASGAIVPVLCGEETLDMVQHEAVVIRLGERGSLLADVARLFGGIRDCSGQHNPS